MKQFAILFAAFIFTASFTVASFAQTATLNKKDSNSALLTDWGVRLSIQENNFNTSLKLEYDGENYKGLVKAAPGESPVYNSLSDSPLKNVVIKADNTFTADITFNYGKKMEGTMTGKLEAEKLSGELNLPGLGKISYWGGKNRKGCAKADRIPMICGAVEEAEINEEGEYRFEYLMDVRTAACVDEYDSEEIENAKIQNMFRELDDQLVCSSNHLSIKPGGLLKLAVSAYFNDFITNAVTKWKMDVNNIDAADDKTVLDFIEDQIKQFGNDSALVSKLQGYKARILKAGGRYNKYKELNK